MNEVHVMLTIIVLAFLLLGIGFNRRDKEWGVVMIAVGVACILGTVAYRIWLALY